MSEWISVEDELPEDTGFPYQVIAAQKKLIGGNYQECHKRVFVQDWNVRAWPKNFVCWQYDRIPHVFFGDFSA